MAHYWVTPTLFLGDPNPNIDSVPTESARDAAVLIITGQTARLPEGRWDLAAEVLRSFGATEEHIRSQIHWAQTGEVIV